MTRRRGLRRLGAFTAPSLLPILAVGFSLASVEPAAPRSLAPLTSVPAITVEPAPEPAATMAVEEPAPEPVPEPVPEPAPEPTPCTGALEWVAAAGLPLPAGVDYLCPSTLFAHHGTACWDDWPCPGSAFIAINLELGAGATPEYLRHVVAHEVCHILDFRDRGWSTEPRADACAAAHGA